MNAQMKMIDGSRARVDVVRRTYMTLRSRGRDGLYGISFIAENRISSAAYVMHRACYAQKIFFAHFSVLI
jgi:hypothetical protein